MVSIQATDQINITIQIGYALFALLIYDHLLTFSWEVDFIWKSKFTLLSWVYLLIRYLMVLCYIFDTELDMYITKCTSMLQFSGYMFVMTSMINSGFQIIYTYAMWNQSRLIVCLLSLLALPRFMLALHSIIYSSCANIGFFDASDEYWTLSNIMALMFNISVIILTVMKTFQTVKEHKRLHMDQHPTLSGIILHNGSVYFGSSLTFSVLDIVLFYCSPYYLRGLANDCNCVLSTIIISRFLLELRQNTLHPNGTVSTQLPYITSTIILAPSQEHTVTAEDVEERYYRNIISDDVTHPVQKVLMSAVV